MTEEGIETQDKNIFGFLRRDKRESLLEREALKKVSDIQAAGTLAHVTTVERLPDILREGILSNDFARRTGRILRRRYANTPTNRVFIAKIKAGGEDEVINLEDLAVRVAPPEESHHVAVLIFNPKIEIKAEASGEWRTEQAVKYRISPKDIGGIAVGGSREALHSFDPEPEMITSLSGDTKLTQSLKNRVLQVMTHLDVDNPARTLPLYDLNGNLLWPKKISHEQIVNNQGSTRDRKMSGE